MAKSARKPPQTAPDPSPPGTSVSLGWFDPKTLDDHPDNWKEHPPEQGVVVGELLDRHGWLAPLTMNRRTGRLLNGHERKRIAIEKGMAAVPVWVVDVPEEDEVGIIASLDTSGSLAKANASKVAAIMDRWKPESSGLRDMMDRLAKASGAAELIARSRPPEFVVLGEDSSPGLAHSPLVSIGDGPGDTYRPQPSHIQMVQLFLTTQTQPEFAGWVEALGTRYGTKNTTETVYECVRRAATQT